MEKSLAVIGSGALNTAIGHQRDQNDIDIVGTYDDVIEYVKKVKHVGVKILAQYPIDSGKKIFIRTDNKYANGIIEAEIAWDGSSAEALLDLILNDENTTTCVNGFNYPSLNLLYMLKMSHRYLKNSPHFLKTMRDIQMMRKYGAVIQPEHEEFYQQRMKDTYNYSHPKLNVSKEGFFNGDGVPYVYDHDSIHEVVKYFEQPAYTYFKPKDSAVMVSKEMFFNDCTEKQRLASVLEEVCVLALERSQIPYPDTDRRKSFDMAHMKVCTSITSGWWREYAWENYDKVQGMYDPVYVDLFWHHVKQGNVELYKGSTY